MTRRWTVRMSSLALTVVMGGAPLSGIARAETPSVPEEITLEASDPELFHAFGRAVAIEGDRALIGASGDDLLGFDAGAAYVFERDADGVWTESVKLTADDGEPGAEFGRSVALQGEVAVIGAPLDDEAVANGGAVYVFERDVAGEWVRTAKLTADDALLAAQFGSSVALSGERLAVAAWVDDRVASNGGAVYLFERDATAPEGWRPVVRVEPDVLEANDNFGAAIALDGDRLVAATPFSDVGADRNVGAAYVFERDAGGSEAWGQTARLAAVDGRAADNFGTAVALRGDTLAIGSPGANVLGENGAGAAYLYEPDPAGEGWVRIEKLVMPEPSESFGFGSGLAMDGDQLVVGMGEPILVGPGNTAYVFERDAGGPGSWELILQLQPTGIGLYNGFGGALALSGATVIAGVPLEDEAETGSGVSLVFSTSVVRLAADGACSDAVELTVSGATPGATVAIARGEQVGQTSIPSGTCDATVVGIDAAEPAGQAPADASGGAVSTYSASIDDCGAVLQAVDLSSCSVSPPVVVDRIAVDERERLIAPDGPDAFSFGESVALDAVTMLVRAVQPGRDPVYVYERPDPEAAWVQVATLYSPDPSEVDHEFGSALVVEGDTAVIGSRGTDPFGGDLGGAHVYRRADGRWELEQTLIPSETRRQGYGGSVALDGERLLVGDSGVCGLLVCEPGAAYVFERVDGVWEQVATLSSVTAGSIDFYGTAVALSGGVAAVSAPAECDLPLCSNGFVYLYGENVGGPGAWGELARFTAPGAGDRDFRFGGSLSMSGSRLVVGAAGSGFDADPDVGESVYIFDWAGGEVEVTRLRAADRGRQLFGSRVDLDGSRIAINTASQSVYLFARGVAGLEGWTQVAKLTPSGGVFETEFGAAIALAGDRLLVGSPDEERSGVFSGAVREFEIAP